MVRQWKYITLAWSRIRRSYRDRSLSEERTPDPKQNDSSGRRWRGVWLLRYTSISQTRRFQAWCTVSWETLKTLAWSESDTEINVIPNPVSRLLNGNSARCDIVCRNKIIVSPFDWLTRPIEILFDYVRNRSSFWGVSNYDRRDIYC
jgi:hypothetical protein